MVNKNKYIMILATIVIIAMAILWIAGVFTPENQPTYVYVLGN